MAGGLSAGNYRYQLTNVRISDGAESGPAYSGPVAITGGLSLTGLAVVPGYKTGVYLSGQHGVGGYYAGSTLTSSFTFTGNNSQLVMPCRTELMLPPPAGSVTAFWRGRVLVAVGSVLIASEHHAVELFDHAKNFIQCTGTITLVEPVDGGIFIGTTDELAFYEGAELTGLRYRQVVKGGVVLGSGVQVRGELLKRGDGVSGGTAMVCIADKVIVAGFSDGGVTRLTEGEYRTAVSEVSATFRIVNGMPQYLAVVIA